MIFVYFVFLLLLYLCIKEPLKATIILAIAYPTLILLPIGNYNIELLCTYFLLFNFVFTQGIDLGNEYIIPKSIAYISILSIISYTISFFVNLGAGFKVGTFLSLYIQFILCYILYKTYIPTYENNKFFISFLGVYLLSCCIVGAIESSSNIHPFRDFLMSIGKELPLAGDNSVRTGFNRTQSLTIWCEAYGVLLTMGLFSVQFLNTRNFIKSNATYLLICVLAIFGVLTTNSRTLFLAAVLVHLFYFVDIRKYTAKFFLFVIVMGVVILLYSDVVVSVYEGIINHEDSGGSTLEMRDVQFDLVLFIIRDDMLFGIGSNVSNQAILNYADDGLHGAESCIFTTSLSRGIVGLVILFVLWGSIVIELLKTKRFVFIFMMAGFILAKIGTLCSTIEEYYILFYIIPLIRITESTYGDGLYPEKII